MQEGSGMKQTKRPFRGSERRRLRYNRRTVGWRVEVFRWSRVVAIPAAHPRRHAGLAHRVFRFALCYAQAAGQQAQSSETWRELRSSGAGHDPHYGYFLLA
jgi:hypothetical protein